MTACHLYLSLRPRFEIRMCPFEPAAPQDKYLSIRNHVLTRWRADVNRYLSLEEAGLKIQSQFQDLVRIAWEFLNLMGYINFGVNMPARPLPGPKPTQSVIVIGAGLAGVSAACQLHRWGYKVRLVGVMGGCRGREEGGWGKGGKGGGVGEGG